MNVYILLVLEKTVEKSKLGECSYQQLIVMVFYYDFVLYI